MRLVMVCVFVAIGGSTQAHNVNVDELEAGYWRKDAQDAVKAKMEGPMNMAVARNVIMFLGDGMSMSTVAAARALQGQRKTKPGEETQLSFESFPIVGLSKTYCVDAQVADSACSATAYLCGVKGNDATIGVDATVQLGECHVRNTSHVDSIAVWALADGRDVGVVTTTRITHASPAGVFAHTGDRDFENDGVVTDAGCDPELTPDIAHQLVHEHPGRNIKVILGGGRRNFVPRMEDGSDPEEEFGARRDGRNLTQEWCDNKAREGVPHHVVHTLPELLRLDATSPHHVLGLFADSHLPYNALAQPQLDPTLRQLTDFAIRKLSQNEKGYFLFVEGGRIDHAHHDNNAGLALDETIAMAEAVQVAMQQPDTLVLVTADHSHVMAYNGYSQRGRDVLGTAGSRDRDKVPYMTLSYTNGPGFRAHTADGIRPDVTLEDEFEKPLWPSHVDVPLSSETHGGEDVAVYARGPHQHMFSGVYEQSHLPHLMAYAACIGPGLHAPQCNAAQPLHTLISLLTLALLTLTIIK